MISRIVDNVIGVSCMAFLYCFYGWIKAESFIIQRICNHNIIDKYSLYCVKCGKKFEVW